jgi:hypothetical protein
MNQNLIGWLLSIKAIDQVGLDELRDVYEDEDPSRFLCWVGYDYLKPSERKALKGGYDPNSPEIASLIEKGYFQKVDGFVVETPESRVFLNQLLGLDKL